MAFWKNIQVAQTYKVSNSTVANWINGAEKRQNDLQIVTIGGRKLLVDSQRNRELLHQMKAKGSKHAPKGERLVVRPKDTLYKLFNDAQLAELYTSLSSRLRIPYKFTYFNGGAKLWDDNYNYKIALSLNPENSETVMSSVARDEAILLEENLAKIAGSFEDKNIINLYDVGCGNGLPAIPIIKEFLALDYQVNYFAIDISEEMIEIAKKYVLEEIGEVNFFKVILDMENQSLNELLLEHKQTPETVNLVLLLGGTVGNYHKDVSIIRKIRDAMSQNDYLLVGTSLLSSDASLQDYEANDFHVGRANWLPDLLGLKEHYIYSKLTNVNNDKYQEYRKLKLTDSVAVEMKIKGINHLLELNNFEEIMVYEFFWYTELELVEAAIKNQFSIQNFTTNKQRTYALMMLCPSR